MSDNARQALILSQTCLNSPHTNQQVKIFRRPTKNRLVCGGLKAFWLRFGNSSRLMHVCHSYSGSDEESSTFRKADVRLTD